MALFLTWNCCSALAPKADTPFGSGNVGMNVGGRRACVAASKPEASSISLGSLHAAPKKLIPNGRLKANPIGTLTIGEPATAQAPELAPREWAPLTRWSG